MTRIFYVETDPIVGGTLLIVQIIKREFDSRYGYKYITHDITSQYNVSFDPHWLDGYNDWKRVGNFYL